MKFHLSKINDGYRSIYSAYILVWRFEDYTKINKKNSQGHTKNNGIGLSFVFPFSPRLMFF
jgi:hypothetical protein